MKETYKSSKVAPKGSSKKSLPNAKPAHERMDSDAKDRQGVIDKLAELSRPV
jgi:hypothetical protein|tara:strand:+ start:913 stop:1068 length:156 start_codon:yes stop_codon:yes gene_type:complete